MRAMLPMSTRLWKGPLRIVVEAPPRLQVLEEEPAASVVLAADAAVDEVHVDRGEDVSAAGQQLAEPVVPGVREVAHVVVAVHDQDEGVGPGIVGIPDAGVDGEAVGRESPVAVPRLRRGAEADELRGVDGLGLDRHRVAVLGAVPVRAASVVEGEDAVGAGEGGVGVVEVVAGEDGGGVGWGQVEGAGAGGDCGARYEDERGQDGGSRSHGDMIR